MSRERILADIEIDPDSHVLYYNNHGTWETVSVEGGASGPPGPQGEPGPQGSAGADGAQGLPGADGAPGAKGEQGTQGEQGPQGYPGADGEDGAPGSPGAKGDQGIQGIQGDTGAIGPSGPSGQGAPVLVATLAGDQATGANTTPVTLTGLVFSYEINSVYRIWFMGRVQPAAATTGCGFQFDVSSVVTSIDVQFFHQLASTGTQSGGHSIADDASVGVSSGMPGTGTYPVTGFGLLRTTTNTGTAQMRFRSKTTAVTTCKAGLTLVVEKIA